VDTDCIPRRLGSTFFGAEQNFLTDKFCYQINFIDIKNTWTDINNKIFGLLKEPKITIEDDLTYIDPYLDEKYRDRQCTILACTDKDINGNIVLRFSKKIETARMMIETVIHEMVHQDLARRFGYNTMCNIGHDSEFMAYAKLVNKYHNIELSEVLEY
jgi:hypothetical protein